MGDRYRFEVLRLLQTYFRQFRILGGPGYMAMRRLCGRQCNANAILFSSFFITLCYCRSGGGAFIILHETGSNNPLGLRRDLDKLPFHPYFSVKDLFGDFLIAYAILRSIPNKLGGVIALALSILVLIVCPF